MYLNDLVADLTIKKMNDDSQGWNAIKHIHIEHLHIDSRDVCAGSLFICLPGFSVDGHDFVDDAVHNGAVAIIAERPLEADVPIILVPDTRRALAWLSDKFYQSPTQALRLIGVTGTNGKTTITHMIEFLLEDQGYSTGRIGTINMKIGQEEYDVANTTPESLHLQRAFAQMVEYGSSHAVIEASSHAIHMGRIWGCNFGIAVFSNLSQDHLDYHGTMEAYKQAKGLLFAQLGHHYSSNDLKYAILNGDDKASHDYRMMTSAQVITYGIESAHLDVKATNIHLSPSGTRFLLESFAGRIMVDCPLLGFFNVYNILAAVSVGLLEGLSLAQMKHSLKNIPGVSGRMEMVVHDQDLTVIIDYAHTPDSLQNVCQTVQEFAHGGDLYCLIGCGGDRDRGKRPIMARIAAQYATMTVLTSDNPRSESPQSILDDMAHGLIADQVRQTKYKQIIDRREAILWAINDAKDGDIVLIAGKGHETYQMIKGEKFHFDDKLVAGEALKLRSSQRREA